MPGQISFIFKHYWSQENVLFLSGVSFYLVSSQLVAKMCQNMYNGMSAVVSCHRQKKHLCSIYAFKQIGHLLCGSNKISLDFGNKKNYCCVKIVQIRATWQLSAVVNWISISWRDKQADDLARGSKRQGQPLFHNTTTPCPCICLTCNMYLSLTQNIFLRFTEIIWKTCPRL